MKLAMRLRTDRSVSSFLPWLAAVVALGGCGGATYSLGDLRGDGGKEGGSSSNSFCFPTLDGGCADSGGASGGFVGSGSGGSGNSGGSGSGGSSSSGFVDDAGSTSSGGCAVSSSVACSGGATGYACTSGDPTMVQPSLSCTNGAFKGGAYDYCCIPWPAGSACTPDQSFPCGGVGSYAYQCNPGAKPTDTDATLSCGDSFPLATGDDEYCCTNP